MSEGVAKGKATIRGIIRAEIWNYERTRPMPAHIRAAAKRIFKCKTRALGHHVQVCSNGHEHIRWNSCQHRSCPECSWPAKQRWLKRTRSRLIDRPHHHFIFTFADELNVLWGANQTEMKKLLFREAKETLIALFADEQYCGALPGIIATIHTWGRPLSLHPHLHCIVTRGGVDAAGQWRDPKRRSALPLPPFVVSRLFQGKYLAAIRRAIALGKLQMPEGITAEDMERRLGIAYEKRWSVFIGHAGGRIDTIVNYLGRYVCGGPIGNSRIKECADGKVTFIFRDYRAGRASGRPVDRPMTLSRHEFMRRWFLHVPERGAKNVRSFGMYAPSYDGPTPDPAPERDPEPKAADALRTPGEGMRCPTCGAALITTLLVRPARDRSPPLGRLG